MLASLCTRGAACSLDEFEQGQGGSRVARRYLVALTVAGLYTSRLLPPPLSIHNRAFRGTGFIVRFSNDDSSYVINVI